MFEILVSISLLKLFKLVMSVSNRLITPVLVGATSL